MLSESKNSITPLYLQMALYSNDILCNWSIPFSTVVFAKALRHARWNSGTIIDKWHRQIGKWDRVFAAYISTTVPSTKFQKSRSGIRNLGPAIPFPTVMGSCPVFSPGRSNLSEDSRSQQQPLASLSPDWSFQTVLPLGYTPLRLQPDERFHL